MSINLKVEEYCHNCPDFEPDVQKQTETFFSNSDPLSLYRPSQTEVKHICETTVECKYKRRCAAQMRYLQKRHTEMMKKETGDGKDN